MRQAGMPRPPAPRPPGLRRRRGQRGRLGGPVLWCLLAAALLGAVLGAWLQPGVMMGLGGRLSLCF